MTESNPISDGTPIAPRIDYIETPLLPIQQEFKALADNMLDFRGEGDFHGEREFFGIGIDATSFLGEIRASSLVDALPAEDEAIQLSLDGDESLETPFDRENLSSVAVRVLGYEAPKHRKDPNGPSQPPYDVIEFEGESDWFRRIQIVFRYGSRRDTKGMRFLTATTNSIEPSMLNFSRELNSDIFIDGIYPFAEDVHREFRDEGEVRTFMHFAERIFNAWMKEREARRNGNPNSSTNFSPK